MILSFNKHGKVSKRNTLIRYQFISNSYRKYGKDGQNMNNFQTYLSTIDDPNKKERMESILNYIKKMFPNLKEEIKWNQPMFTDHGTFIIAFSIAKGHIAVAPEPAAIKHFEKEIEKAGYSYTNQLFRIKWKDKVDYDLLSSIVAYNIEDKKDAVKFWR